MTWRQQTTAQPIRAAWAEAVPKAGREKCWVCGDTTAQLHPVNVSMVPDARLALQRDKGLDRCGLPLKDNKLCSTCFPLLPPHSVIGADVAVRVKDSRGLWVFVKGAVHELAGPQQLRLERDVFSVSRQWAIEWQGSLPGPATLSTEAVGDAAKDWAALKRSEESSAQRVADDFRMEVYGQFLPVIAGGAKYTQMRCMFCFKSVVARPLLCRRNESAPSWKTLVRSYLHLPEMFGRYALLK